MSLVWSPGFNGVTDPDAQTYIAAVEAADGQAIEGNVAYAINDFVVGCKTDGIWDAIKASCILAGARTLSGALVPLKGTAPTNNGFLAADYNRETGLVGASGKSLDSGLDMQDVPAADIHISVNVTTAGTNNNAYLGGKYLNNGATLTEITRDSTRLLFRNRNVQSFYSASGDQNSVGFIGSSRNSTSSFDYRFNGATGTQTASLGNPHNGDFSVFRRTAFPSTNARLSFYSIGEAIDLEKLDTRVTRLMNLLPYALVSGLPSLSTMDPDAASYIGAVYSAGGTLS